jgi:DNA-binding transcriptional MerR regulator
MPSLPIPVDADSGAAREYAIGELCERTGLSPRTIRYYEEVGLLPGVRRRAAGRRVYGEDALERLSFIGRLKTLGLSLLEIKELNELYALAGSTHDMLSRLHGLLGEHLRELDGRIEALTALRDEMHGYRDHVARRLTDGGAHTSEREDEQ